MSIIMGNDLEIKKKELKDKLENELYVERYDTFKETVTLLNEALINIGINYTYNYDTFCSDFTLQCLKYLDLHPDVDLTDANQIVLHTLKIVMLMIEVVKNKTEENDKFNIQMDKQDI